MPMSGHPTWQSHAEGGVRAGRAGVGDGPEPPPPETNRSSRRSAGSTIDVNVDPMESWFETLGQSLVLLGPLGYLAAIGVMFAVAILPIPAEAPAMVNGAMFGPWAGTLVTWTGAMLGAITSFEIGRRWGRPIVRRFVSDAALERVDQALDGAGWWGLLLARFTPVIAFTALNWGSGLANLPRKRFLWTTALGILPGALLFTATGTGISALIRRWGTEGAIVASIGFLMALGWGLRRTRRARADARTDPDNAVTTPTP